MSLARLHHISGSAVCAPTKCGNVLPARQLTRAQSRQQPRVFPGGPPPQYKRGLRPLNFGGQKRSGAFDAVWPPATIMLVLAYACRRVCSCARRQVHRTCVRYITGAKKIGRCADTLLRPHGRAHGRAGPSQRTGNDFSLRQKSKVRTCLKQKT